MKMVDNERLLKLIKDFYMKGHVIGVIILAFSLSITTQAYGKTLKTDEICKINNHSMWKTTIGLGIVRGNYLITASHLIHPNKEQSVDCENGEVYFEEVILTDEDMSIVKLDSAPSSNIIVNYPLNIEELSESLVKGKCYLFNLDEKFNLTQKKLKVFPKLESIKGVDILKKSKSIYKVISGENGLEKIEYSDNGIDYLIQDLTKAKLGWFQKIKKGMSGGPILCVTKNGLWNFSGVVSKTIGGYVYFTNVYEIFNLVKSEKSLFKINK